MTAETLSTPTCSTRDAARLLGISVRTAQLWVEDGRLQAWKTPGGHRRILVESVDRLLIEQRCAGMHTAVRFGLLLVKEDEEERNALKALLGMLLPECLVASTDCGFDGLIRIGEMSPEVLVMDLRLKGLDSACLTHALVNRARARAMLVVVLTESVEEREKAQERLPGAVVLVDVPVDGDGLATIVRSFLGTSGRRRRVPVVPPPGSMQ